MRDLLFKDFGWKLFSLLLAAFIWVTVHKLIEEPQLNGGSTPVSRTTYGDLPVLIVATAADMHMYHVKPDKVSVTVSGPSDIMAELKANDIRVTVDLSSFDPAKELLETAGQPVEVSVPGGVTLVKVSPAKLAVILPPKH